MASILVTPIYMTVFFLIDLAISQICWPVEDGIWTLRICEVRPVVALIFWLKMGKIIVQINVLLNEIANFYSWSHE